MHDAEYPDLACDVLVIGGGPAGSTAAALLARRGRDVVLIEKSEHPRFHIGESLLPRNLAVLERLGVADEIRAIGVHKPGAEFVSDSCGRSVAFPFRLALAGGATHSYQVRRSEFDKILFDNATRAGARSLQRTRATDIERHPRHSVRDGPVRLRGDAPDHRALRTGRVWTRQLSRTQARRAAHRQAQQHRLRVCALSRRDAARCRDGRLHLDPPRGGCWFWVIPLPDGVTSIGFVGTQAAFRDRGGDNARFLAARIAASPTLSARLAGATRCSKVTATGNYSYRAARSWDENICLIGDAFAFVDPMFSSGVLMAMTAGELGAGTADAWLDDPARGRVMARRAERRLAGAIDRISWLIYRINDPVMRGLFLSPRNTLRMRDGLVSLLAGNLDRDLRGALPVLAFKCVYRVAQAAERMRRASRLLKAGRIPSQAMREEVA